MWRTGKLSGTRVEIWAPSEPPSTVPQSLGVCICAEGFGGPDCATKLDGGQLVWETLMDSRLSAVSCGCHSPRRGHTACLWIILPAPFLGPPLRPYTHFIMTFA